MIKIKSNVSFILELFLKLLKESNLGFSVTTDGDFIFMDQRTGEKLYIKKDDFIDFYDKA